MPGGAASGAEAATFHDVGVVRGDFERELLLTGELEAVNSISIKAPQTSLFQLRIQFMAEEGTMVRKGDPLLDFDNSSLASKAQDLETQILDAETQIVMKRAELASSMKDLEIELAEKQYAYDSAKVDASIDPNVLSRKDFSERELALDKASKELAETKEQIALTRDQGKADLDVLAINRDKLKKDLESTRNDLDLLSIKAPADGLVVYERRHHSTLKYQEGDSCWPGQTVLRLPDLSEMQVSFNVNEVDVPLIREGMPVRISLDAFPGRELSGKILNVPSMAVKPEEDSKIAVFKVTGSLGETWHGEMKPGMSVLGRVVVEDVKNAPLVAREDVSFDGSRYWLHPRASGGEDRPAPVEIHPESRNVRYYLLSEEEYAQLTGSHPDVRRSAAAFAEGS